MVGTQSCDYNEYYCTLHVHRVLAIAQLVERRTVVDKLADILSSCTRDSSVGRAEDCSG